MTVSDVARQLEAASIVELLGSADGGAAVFKNITQHLDQLAVYGALTQAASDSNYRANMLAVAADAAYRELEAAGEAFPGLRGEVEPSDEIVLSRKAVAETLEGLAAQFRDETGNGHTGPINAVRKPRT